MPSKRTPFGIDVAILALILIALVVDFTGGFYTEPFGWRVSMRREERPLLLALGLAFVRWRWWRSPDFLGRPLGWYARVFRRDADDFVPGPPSRWSGVLAVAGIFVLAAVLMQEQLRQMMSVPDMGDPFFSVWRMGWIYRQLLGDPRALFDANIFYPAELSLTFSEPMLLPSLLSVPMLAAGIHPLVAYNVMVVAGFPLSGLTTYLLVRRLTMSPSAAFIAAVYYMAHPYRFEHYSHLEQQTTIWMPVALWALVKFGETRRWWLAMAAALSAIAQLYSSMYLGVFLPYYAGTVFLVLLVAKRWDWRPLIRPALAAAAVAAVLAVPLARPYLAAQAAKGDRATNTVEYYSAGVTDYFRPHFRLATHHGWWLPDVHPERALFPGVTPMVLSGLALVPPLGPIRLAFTAGLALSFDLSRGMKGHLYPYLYEYVPPFRGMRVAARFSIMLGISLAVLSAFGARKLLGRLREGWPRRLALAALVALMMFDLRPTLQLRPVWADIPRIYQDLAGKPGVVLAEFPFELRRELTTDDAPFMYFSYWHGHDMVNGYSAFTPDGHKALVSLMRDFPDAASIAALRTRGVTHITTNCEFIGDGCKAFMTRMDTMPEFKLVRIAHWLKKPTRLYELTR